MPLLLCDLDDTLVDRTATFRWWVDGFLSARGLAADEAAWIVEQDQRGYRRRSDLFEAMKDRFGLDEAVGELVGGFYREFLPMFRCAAGVPEALARARNGGWTIAIVTNGAPTQEGKIAAAGLGGLVDAWCVSSLEGVRKPGIEILERAAAKCGTRLDDSAWMVGDSPEFDIAAAEAAGIGSAWVAGDREWPSGLPFRPTLAAGSFPEAVDQISPSSSASRLSHSAAPGQVERAAQ